jgi:hypothetical protein
LSSGSTKLEYMVFKGSTAATVSDGKSWGMSLAAGTAIAASCFALLFAVMARLIPLFGRFTESNYSRLLPITLLLFIFVPLRGLYLRRRSSRLPEHANKKSPSTR